MTAVYIPTRARHDNLRKVMPRWLECTPRATPIVLVIDRSETAATKALIAAEGWERVEYVAVKNNSGIGNVRHQAVADAAKRGFNSIIMSDDDLRPAERAPMNTLLRYAARKNVLGIGATRSYHSLLSNGWSEQHNGPMLCPSGWGLQTFGLNVANAVAVGNFDVRLTCFGEDAELMRAGLSCGFPWLVHCGVKVEPIGKRYDPGGLATLTGDRDARTVQEQACQYLIHQRWPDFTSTPPKPSRVAWQRMYDYYIPDWRKKSIMHGGNL